MAKSLHMFMLMLFIFLVLHVLPFTFATEFSYLNRSLSHDDECLILFLFKQNMPTNDAASSDTHAYPKLASWKLNGSEGRNDCCSWDGVECNRESSRRHVIGLDLNSSFLYGPINHNSSLFDLLHLRRLNLADNDFRFSQIPSRIGRFSMLTYLDLSSSNFNGHIPSLTTLSRLSYLDLSHNRLDGRNLSVWLGKLPNLSYLNLVSNNLGCPIPPSIGNQTQLRQLYLDDNHMVGQIPSSLMNLTRLTDLALGDNEFIGCLPSLESLSNLESLYLSYNNFDRWKLPIWFGKLNMLGYVDLRDVNLYGEIPSLILNMTQVIELDLSMNKIEGLIPSFPSTMTKLRTLDLAGNRLKGRIPSALSNLKNLDALFLDNNNISSTVELDIFVPLKKLKALYLSGNAITLTVFNNHTTHALPKFETLELQSCNLRVFPDFLRFQDQLHDLVLDDNKINGLVPEWMGNMSRQTLQLLTLSNNFLIGFEKNWSVVPWVGLLILDLSDNRFDQFIPVPPPDIKIFFMSNNSLIGEIPPSICDLQSLELLDLSFNNITGSIPPCLGNLNNSLLELNLRGNSLRGTIPNTFINGSKLQNINLSENKLVGKLPRSLQNCLSLQILELGNNHIEDMFPFWLGALSELQVLILRSNRLYGDLRMQNETNSKFLKLRIIDLSYNSFSGDLPHQYFQEWPAMKETELDATYMQASLVVYAGRNLWFENFSYSMKMTNKGVTTEYWRIINIFVAIDLSSNKFGGKIPESIKSLVNLQLLNLSNNELVDAIPSSLGNLTRLESLDLSNNQLSGKMPQELAQLNFLGFLNVSHNLLTGPIPEGGQFNTFDNASFIGNTALCGGPLSKKCGHSKVSKPPTVSFGDDTKSDFPNGVDWVFILSGVGSGLVIGLVFGNHLTTRYHKWFLKRLGI